MLYPAHNYMYRSAKRRAYKQLGIRTDTEIIAPRLVSMESIFSRLNFEVLPPTVLPINPITWRPDMTQSEFIGP